MFISRFFSVIYLLFYEISILNLRNSQVASNYFYFFDFPEDGANCINSKYSSYKINLQEAIEYLSNQFKACGSILFIVDDLAADAEIVKKRGPLTQLAISGRHTHRSLWVLTQKYNSIGKDVRAQAQWICSFYSPDKNSFKDLLDECNVGMNKETKNSVEKYTRETHRGKLLLQLHSPFCYALD